MAEITTIARPYAQAAFDVARDGNALDAWETFLGGLAACGEHSEMLSLAKNPNVAAATLVDILGGASAPQSEEQKNFLALMVEQKRVDALPAVYRAFVAHKDAHESVAAAHIVTAYAMDDEAAKTSLIAAVERKFAKKVKATFSEDASLLGGFLVTVGDQVLDMSMRAKLARI